MQQLKTFINTPTNRLSITVVVIMIVVTIINVTLSNQAIKEKPISNESPYSTKITSLVVPERVCAGSVMTFTLETKILAPNTILTAYQTWYDVTHDRTLVSMKVSEGEVRQYSTPKTLAPRTVTTTVPLAPAGSVIEFDRGYTAEGAKDFILPITLTVAKDCK